MNRNSDNAIIYRHIICTALTRSQEEDNCNLDFIFRNILDKLDYWHIYCKVPLKIIFADQRKVWTFPSLYFECFHV